MRGMLLTCAISVFLIALSSCRDVAQVIRPPAVTNYEAFITKGSPYVKDEPFDVFLAKPWYSYDEANHIIWPVFQVYALKANQRYYKLQVIDYYDDQSQPGNYTLRIQPEGQAAYEWSFEAQGCGNVYTNLSYKECLKDPEQNIYTYLNLETRQSWKMATWQARSRGDWHIAFNGTEVKINAGDQGPGQTRIGDLYLYQDFFFNGAADFQEIAEVSFSDKGQRFFDLDLDVRSAAFALPPGVERVVFEDDWFRDVRGSRKAVDSSWWIVKGGEGNTFSKFRFREIDEVSVGRVVESTFTLEFFYQGQSDSQFEATPRLWKLPMISSRERLLKWCLDFDSQEIIECSDSRWDLQLSVRNRGRRRRWQINVNAGAMGPLTQDVARIYQTAPKN